MQQKFLDVLESKQSEESPPVVSSTEIQKKIPVVPLVEQLVLQIMQAESVSNSKISNMSFSESDFAVPTDQVATTEQQEPTETSEGDEASPTDSEDPANAEVEKPFDQTLLEGLKQVTVTITVESPGYKELEKFLSLIGHSLPGSRKAGVAFSRKTEVTSVEQDIDEPLVYAITLSTFYMSAYPELAVDAPEMNVPEPGNKKNPLFVNTKDEEE